jgi:glycosyltransferase involved in cell wall biosynthesis
VYPSIHREPFGLVAAEAMSHGTPVVVPDQGGITEVVEVEGRRGGLTFKSWDSGDLADQLARLLSDEGLYQELRQNARGVAEYFSVDRLVERVLHHLKLQAVANESLASATT